jgi:hypothetical protein
MPPSLNTPESPGPPQGFIIQPTQQGLPTTCPGWDPVKFPLQIQRIGLKGKNTAAGLIGSDVWPAHTLGNIQTVR